MNEEASIVDGVPSVDVASMTADIVAAYVTKNVLVMSELPAFIRSIYTHLSKAAVGGMIVEKPIEEPKAPAVPIKKSITDDFIICLEDGHKFKSMRRHLSTVFGMTPEQYRKKWGLPNDYPMVAPSYAKTRSELAKSTGLGMSRKAAPAPVKKGKAAAATKKAA